ncbi:hypothetical protein Tco_0484645 [Tanacetum coccineum]
MSTIRDIKSKLTKKALDALCTKYHISSYVHPTLPGPDKNILQCPDGKVGVYTRFFDFANYRIPLSQFLVDVLDHFYIHLSQLSMFGAAKVSYFEILCRVHGFQPSVNCFRMFYTSSYTKGWMSFVKRSDAAPVCLSKPLDFVKNLNDHFFWVDYTTFPLSVSLKSKILSKDPSLKLSQYDTEVCDFLRTHTAHSGNFWNLSYAGLRVEIDLFTFIRHSDPTKVRIGERDLAKREVKLLKMIEGRTISLDPPVTAALGDSDDSINKLFDKGDNVGQEHSVERDDDVLEETIAKVVSEVAVEKTKKSKRKRKIAGDASASTFPPKRLREDYHVLTSITGGKSLATIRSLIPEGSSVSSVIAEPRDDGLADSVSGLNLWTYPPSKRYVISSDDSHYSDSRFVVNFFARYVVADTLVMTISITTTVSIDAFVVQVSKDKVKSKNLETFGDSASVGEANVNASGSSKLNEPTTSSDSFYASQDLDSKDPVTNI